MDEQESLDHITIPKSLYRRIEENVADLFCQLNIHRYPVDPLSIAAKLGYELKPFTTLEKRAKRMLFFKDVDGISFFDPNQEKTIICYRTALISERLRFTIGHEIGHIRMGHKEESDLARRVADYYSAYLLAPSPWIGQAGCKGSMDVAKAFVVSEPCAARCFARYENWCNIPFRKDYEKTLINLLS